MKLFLLFVVLGALQTSALAAGSVIELRGVTEGVGATQLSLRDTTNDTTRWVEVGQTFAGFAVKAYDPATETATLLKDGREIRLRINSAKIAEARTEEASASVAVAIRNNLRQIAGAADQYFLENGKIQVLLKELIGPDKYIKRLVPIDGEDYSALVLKAGAQPLSVVTARGQTVDYWPKGEPEPMRPPTGNFTYTLKAGDTAKKVADQAGVELRDLQRVNPSVDWSKLKIGQSIKIP
ncbi:MAG: LysM domain-containing protein [Opitutaceae bacterium]